MTEIVFSSRRSISFLKKWKPEGPWVVTSIQTDRKGISTETFNSSQEEELFQWLEKYNGKRNIYFSVNSFIRPINSKARKEDIKSADWLHVDIDPEKGQDPTEERDRILGLLTDNLPKSLPKPTCIVFSGGGYQAFWRLKESISVEGDLEKCEDFERYNRRLEQLFKGDHCFNIDRIMRLPGTVNIPDAKKLKAGRTPELATVIEFNSLSYDISDFKPVTEVQMKDGSHQGGDYGIEVEISGNVERLVDIHELDEWNVPDRIKVIIVQGHHPDQPKQKDNSRSAWLFDCVCGLVRAKVPDSKIFAILTDPTWGISESVLEAKPNAEKYAIRQIKNAKEFSEDPNLREMNSIHAVIGNIGGKCRVIEEIEDEVLKRSRLTISSFQDVANRYMNVHVKIGVDKDGNDMTMPKGKWWLNHVMRRQFNYIKFLPNGDKKGVYNLWRGFAVQPVDGDCSLYLNHIRDNVCNGNEIYFYYIIRWMARAVQEPGQQGHVAIVIRGGKGSGKSLFAVEFGKLFGRHYLEVSNPSHLVGNFNAHLRDVICLFADEAFFAGDKRHESVLKTLVTSDSIQIEAKGVDTETYPNYVHLIMAANDPHVIRASGDERRYFVLNVGEAQKQNKKYFKAIVDQMNAGGREALLYYLQSIDLKDFEVRDVPDTDALAEQKLLSLSVEEEWWYRKLNNGIILDYHNEWNGLVLCDKVVSDYVQYSEKWKVARRGNETALGKFLNRICPHLDRSQKLVDIEERDERGEILNSKKRLYHYDFGSLEKCRKAWEDLYGETRWIIETEKQTSGKSLI